ncbi:DUF7511 domain-containing protein [Halopiger aswanensis]|uniref:DUF7511 domain-containing protein n=1 Tax=Halopiger aswanensis TaxID=148449 RepID=A0A3R7HL56_9EURY|nr:hypothetical protein [Halopiger aswanensis]RKD98384.1 hypothetical protein ATJ93_1391 [Halopiger aswanensis]
MSVNGAASNPDDHSDRDGTDGADAPEWNGSKTPGPDETPRSTLLSVVLESESTGRPTCTIYPPDVAAPYRTTTWITAHGDAFVSLEEWR